MTLSQFLLRRNERRGTWLGVRAWVPARTDRYSWLRVAAVITGTTLAAAGGVGLLALVIMMLAPEPNGPTDRIVLRFFAPFALEFGACIGLCWSLASRFCWNRRAGQLSIRPDDPILAAPWPRLGVMRRFGLGGIYSMTVGLLIPLLLFHAIENARGAWAWRAMRTRLTAAGECFELPCIIPPLARDAENFFATPFWAQFAYQQERTAGGSITNVWPSSPSTSYTTNFSLPTPPETVKRRSGVLQEPSDGRIDLAAWAAHFRSVTTNTAKSQSGPQRTFPLPATPGDPAKDVLLALTKFDATLAEFAAAASRPRNRYPIRYEDAFNALLPHLAALKSGANICQLRATARLAAGDSAGAAADTLLGFRLGESLNEEPLLISMLVRLACDSIAIRTLWLGLADHRWTDPQLAEFQRRLDQIDFGSGMVRALEGERAMGNETMEWLRRQGGRSLSALDELGSEQPANSSSSMRLGFFLPSGWLRQNQVGLLHGYQLIIDHARTNMNRTNRVIAQTADQRPGDPTDVYVTRIMANPSPFNLLAKMLLPAISKATAKANRAQATARMAGVACALERYRLAHGTFPATLGELVPAFLPAIPADWMGGQPLRYERTDNGWFRLWSIGEDGKDDDGVFRLTRDGGRSLDEILDWPWPVPLPTRDARLF